MALTKPRAYQIFDLDYKQSVRVLATTNVTLSGGAPNVVDSIDLEANDRVLVKDQSTASQNGLYRVQTVGTGSNGTWVRTVDGDQTGEIQAGMIVMVTEGTVYKDTQWKLITNDPIVIGVTALTFELNTSTSSINNGNTNVTISELGGNVAVSVRGTANVAVFTTTGLTANNIATDGNLVVGNNLVVNGNLTYINITDLNVEDPIIGLGRGPNNTPLTTNDGKDRGEQLWYYTSSEQSAFIGYDNSAGKLIAAGNVTIANEIVTVNSYGTLVAGTLESASVSASGNVAGGNILFGSGVVSGTGNVFATNLTGTLQTAAQTNITSVGTLGSLTVTANVQGGNVLTGGSVSATGNIQGGNVLFGSGIVSGTGNIYANNIFANITGNIDAAGANTQVQFADTGDLLGASANFTFDKATNLLTVSNGNIVGGNLLTAGLISATSTITSSANIVGGNLLTAGLISATGNVTGNYILGNGALLTGLPETYNNANVTTLLANLGSNIISSTGNITTTANIAGGNLLTSGTISATGNINGGNVVATGLSGTLSTAAQTNITLLGTLTSLSVTGNVQGGNLRTVGLVSAAGNVIGGNVIAGANVQAANINASNSLSGGNILTVGQISATGNVTGNFFMGNGSLLTGLNVGASNSIANGTTNINIPVSSGNIAMSVQGQSNTVVISTGTFSMYGTFAGPKTLEANVLVAPNTNAVLFGPVSVDPDNNISVPDSSTLYILGSF